VRSRFDPRQRQKDFSSSHCVQTGSGAHPASCTQWVPGVLFPGVKPGRGVTLTTHPNLVPRSRMSRSYTSSLPQAPSRRVVGQLFNTRCHNSEDYNPNSPPIKPQISRSFAVFATTLRNAVVYAWKNVICISSRGWTPGLLAAAVP
jgi:hypothetical protein